MGLQVRDVGLTRGEKWHDDRIGHLSLLVPVVDGALGRFNRAQRSFLNYNENFPTTCFQFIAASFVFPKQAFVCMMLFCI